MKRIFRDELFWLAASPWALFLALNIWRWPTAPVVYLCDLLAATALCRALYRLIKRPEPFVWIAAVASLVATALLTLIILVVIGLP